MASSRGTRSRGRGTAAAFGFLLLVAGLIGAGVLFFLATQRPSTAIERFARAAAGCTTTLDFQSTGTYYVYEELDDGGFEPTDGCTPSATPGQPFVVVLRGPTSLTTLADASITYDSSGYVGTSVQRFEITTPGLYEVAVVADDVRLVAAVGRDPDEGVSGMRRTAVLVGAVGVLLGLLLLVLAGRRSRKAATPSVPDGPSLGTRTEPDVAWPPAAPSIPRMPINPQQPDVPAVFTPPPPPLPARERGAGLTAPSWQPPAADEPPVSSETPVPLPPPRAPDPKPVLPPPPPR